MRESWSLPKSINIGGINYKIRSDFRAVIDILIALSDPELKDVEKMEVMYRILYYDWEKIPYKYKTEAIEKASKFIDAGSEDEEKNHARIMDWEQDAPILIPAINDTLGYEIRSRKYVHWWTFLGAYMSMKDSVATTVISIRKKQSKHQKLEKWEKEFVRENKSICNLRKKLTKEEQEEKERINKWLG